MPCFHSYSFKYLVSVWPDMTHRLTGHFASRHPLTRQADHINKVYLWQQRHYSSLSINSFQNTYLIGYLSNNINYHWNWKELFPAIYNHIQYWAILTFPLTTENMYYYRDLESGLHLSLSVCNRDHKAWEGSLV